MAKKILVSYDFNGNEVQNVKLHNVAGAPSSLANGQAWYDTGTHKVQFRINGVTVDPLARSTHTGTQLAATISDFDTQVRTSRLDQMAAPTASVSLNSQKVTNLSPGTAGTDAVNLNQLNEVLNGRSFKDACRLATTANHGLSGLSDIDGETPLAGDRILVRANTDASENGIWIAAAGAWARASDADNTTPDSELKAGVSVAVTGGSTYADTQWTLTTDGPITVGTTNLTFAQTGTGTTYSEGNGIDISGSTIAVDPAVVVRKYSADIGNGASTSITVTHSLNTKDITWAVRQNSDDAFVECECVATSTSQATFTFAVAPATDSLRVTIHG
jgi:hypothetical protein